MICREIYTEENEQMSERCALAVERLQLITGEESVKTPFLAYFRSAAEFLLLVHETYDNVVSGHLDKAPMEELEAINRALYEDIRGDRYQTSFANPTFAKEMLGETYGPILCALYAELRTLIGPAFEGRRFYLTIYTELFIEIYNLFEQDDVSEREVRNTIYWFMSDYTEDFAVDRLMSTVTEERQVLDLQKLDFTGVRYLYETGAFVKDSDIAMASYLNDLPEEEIQKIADTVSAGLFRAFTVQGNDIHKKKTVQLRFRIGLERIAAAVQRNLRKEGVESLVFRMNFSMGGRTMTGLEGSSANEQYDYDHRYDGALILDRRLKERRLDMLRKAYEENKEAAALAGGPVLIETFGEDPFTPVKNPDAWQLTKEQTKISQEYGREVMAMYDEYCRMDTTAFCIIDFPSPAIGPDFKEIFHETIKVNTLELDRYQKIQQSLIDALDRGYEAHIEGMNGNETDLTVALIDLPDPAKQTKFENCLADCNIPLGEVFTSPKLTGTNGLLHVKHFFLDGMEFKNLKLRFKDGMIAEYSCENFESEEENLELIRDNILFHHDTLPMGEFAIGTNTTAYAMGRKYGIGKKLPILIEEKTGPHFAVGDTCYSYAEDHAVFNPDGKEIIARDNEVTVKRKTEPEKAYFSCHTDITIPYDELGGIQVRTVEGDIELIREGRFVLPGTEALNEALDTME